MPISEKSLYISEGPDEYERLTRLKGKNNLNWSINLFTNINAGDIENSNYPSKIYNRPNSLEDVILYVFLNLLIYYF